MTPRPPPDRPATSTAAFPVSALPARVPALALEICRRIGTNPDGPVGARLIDACAALPPDGVPEDSAGRDALVARLIDDATNRETYFFRDRRQLAALGVRLAGDGRGGGRPLALWSAGCATGEEAYSLAILLREAGLGGVVTATDISRAALAVAGTAAYRTGPMSPCREVRTADHSHLPLLPDGRRTVAPAIRAAVRLREHNILSGPPDSCPFDAVVCRNVLIYMSEAARMAAFAVLVSALRPGGLLLLGPGDRTPPLDPVAHGLRALFHDGAALLVKEGAS